MAELHTSMCYGSLCAYGSACSCICGCVYVCVHTRVRVCARVCAFVGACVAVLHALLHGQCGFDGRVCSAEDEPLDLSLPPGHGASGSGAGGEPGPRSRRVPRGRPPLHPERREEEEDAENDNTEAHRDRRTRGESRWKQGWRSRGVGMRG